MIAAPRARPPESPQSDGGDLKGFLTEAVRPALYMILKWIERRYGIEPSCAECRRRRGGRG